MAAIASMFYFAWHCWQNSSVMQRTFVAGVAVASLHQAGDTPAGTIGTTTHPLSEVFHVFQTENTLISPKSSGLESQGGDLSSDACADVAHETLNPSGPPGSRERDDPTLSPPRKKCESRMVIILLSFGIMSLSRRREGAPRFGSRNQTP